MAKKAAKPRKTSTKPGADVPGAGPEQVIVAALAAPVGKPSALLDTRVIYCGDCLEQLQKLPAGCIDLIYIDPPFNSNRNYEVFWGEPPTRRSAPSATATPAPLPGGVHRLHAAALRGTGARAEKDRLDLLLLRLARIEQHCHNHAG